MYLFNDHNFVLSNCRIRFNVPSKVQTRKIDIERLQDPLVQEPYDLEISNHFDLLSSMIEAAELNKALKIVNSTITNAAEKIINFKRY